MLGQRIKLLRKERKMTQQDLADRLSLAKSTISQYENEVNEPDNNTLQKIADIFEVSVDFLLGRDTIPTTSNNLPTLTPKDERDIARDLERMLNDLESNESMAFDGESDDAETRELLRLSLEQSMRIAKQLAKKKFTPKKHKK